MTVRDRRPLLVSKGWIQGCALVAIFGFFVIGMLAFRTYDDGPPIPDRVESPSGELLYTADDIKHGQQIFLAAGLMEYGSVLGHGAWLGPDYTADYLRRASRTGRGWNDVTGQWPRSPLSTTTCATDCATWPGTSLQRVWCRSSLGVFAGTGAHGRIR
ncbi:hypothetical protein JMUB6875_51500 [Nocardia sp. JMUB6875]